ncbi:MAG: NADH-quinone oxidoreductase subunit L [Candidatus Caenarcaniphilales bacterium]|nr:NADH-quinone oxidoreductase subunit L [Candidatus Caenarcaniphilales bacterium]
MLNQYSWIIPLLPLLAFFFIILGGYKKRILAASVSIGAVALGFIYSLALLFTSFGSHKPYELSFNWIKSGSFHLDGGILIDPLAIVMLIVVTSVSLLVQIYSHGYMHEDSGYAKFFSYLSLFTASMLGLVLSPNLFQVYIFWELVGLCSYLLIGFWHTKESAAAASLKAFVVNRIGDCGLLLGLLLFAFFTQGMWPDNGFLSFGSLGSTVQTLVQNNVLQITGLVSLTTIALLMLLGPMAKSAQFPLHVWLPDAMEGPTPISALIHAATMVAAGVYLLARLFPIFEAAPLSLTVVAIIGAFTAIFSATIALSQNDIKKALAYSTCSQLGYMVMSVGLGAWKAAIFHLVTHAFFKALLFLGSGSVIHGCHHEQDMRHFGGLSKKMPITHWTFLLGTIAIAGVPPLAGFWSKEQIIGAAWQAQAFGVGFNPIFIVASLTAGLTAFYMFRIYFKTFTGTYRGDTSHGEPHESPLAITFPLMALAVPSVLIGLLGTHLAVLGGDQFAHYISPSSHGHALTFAEFIKDLFQVQALLPLGLSFLGILLAFLVYAKEALPINDFFKQKLSILHKASQNKWYIDELYEFVLNKALMPAFNFVWSFFDKFILDGFFVGGITQLSKLSGWTLAKVQTGQVQTYIGIFVLGILIVGFLFISNGLYIEYQIDDFLIKAAKLKAKAKV